MEHVQDQLEVEREDRRKEEIKKMYATLHH